MKASDIPKKPDVFQTLEHKYFVSDRVRDELEESGVTGAELLRYTFGPVDLEKVPDLASTWEHFGLSKLAEPFDESVFAQPLLLVKPVVVELLQKLKVCQVEFVPIALS